MPKFSFKSNAKPCFLLIHLKPNRKKRRVWERCLQQFSQLLPRPRVCWLFCNLCLFHKSKKKRTRSWKWDGCRQSQGDRYGQSLGFLCRWIYIEEKNKEKDKEKDKEKEKEKDKEKEKEKDKEQENESAEAKLAEKPKEPEPPFEVAASLTPNIDKA